MTTHISIAKAQPVTAESVETVVIHIDRAAPEHATLADAAAFYDREAAKLADALVLALPGGTLHALLVALLERKASLLRVRG